MLIGLLYCTYPLCYGCRRHWVVVQGAAAHAVNATKQRPQCGVLVDESAKSKVSRVWAASEVIYSMYTLGMAQCHPFAVQSCPLHVLPTPHVKWCVRTTDWFVAASYVQYFLSLRVEFWQSGAILVALDPVVFRGGCSRPLPASS
jgi:hypothetical protein